MLFEHLLDEDDRAFLADVRAFMDTELTPDLIAADDGQRSMVADPGQSQRWCDKLRKHRWQAGLWPREAGGPGLTRTQNFLLLYEAGLRGAPHLSPQGLNYVGPTLVEFGTAEQKARFLPRILDGTDIWCQGFSEPGAGSDLAAVSTFAERRGDAYFVSGSKIWTTDGHLANWIFCLVRTSREQSRDALSFILVDMDSPGITVRPIRLMSGDHDVNQVFFDEVEVPVENLVAGEGEGWKVSKFLLEIERGAFVFAGRLRRRFGQLRERVIAQGRMTPEVEDEFTRLDIDLIAYECTELRLGNANSDRSNAMAEASVIKIEWTELLRRIDDLAVSLGEVGELAGTDDTFGTSVRREGQAMTTWVASYLNNKAATVYGGSNEIQRNLVFRALRSASFDV